MHCVWLMLQLVTARYLQMLSISELGDRISHLRGRRFVPFVHICEPVDRKITASMYLATSQ